MRRRLRAAAPVKVAEIHLREGVPRVELHCAHEAPGRIVEPIELRKRDTEQEIEACRIRAFGQRGAQARPLAELMRVTSKIMTRTAFWI